MGLFSPTAKAIATKNIFISYRVNDTAGETGRLVDSLKQYFYEEQIFVDIEKIEPGVDFTEAIAKSLELCDVLLAIIGPNWQGLNTVTNTSRINNADDWVRLEISTALKRNIRVVPVLVDGGVLPSEDQLPDDLKPLIKRQTYEISNKRWKYDTEQLIRFLVKSVGIPLKPQHTEPVQQQKSWWSKNYLWVIIVGVSLIIISSLASNFSDSGNGDKGGSQPVYDNGGSQQNDHNTPEQNVVKPETDPVVPEQISSVDGIWNDANGLYYLDIVQNGSGLSITSYSLAGQQTGQGSGTINNNEVALTVNVMNFGLITINATLSGDNSNLRGTTKIENNGAAYSEPLHLIKRIN